MLQDGDLVQFDYAPDYKYYQSDVTRVFPANGTFTPRQREMYEIYLKLYQALMTSIQVHERPIDVIHARCRRWTRSWRRIASPTIGSRRPRRRWSRASAPARRPTAWATTSASRFTIRAGCRRRRFEPGRVFTIEPQMRLEEEHLGIRLEDMILITDTGYENLSQFVPIEVADIEKAMTRHGLSDGIARARGSRD